jgi:penicillin-binding protein 1C
LSSAPRRLAPGALVLLLAAPAAFVLWPLPPGLLDRRPVAAVRFTDREGLLLREVASRADGRSVPLPPLEPIPPLVRAAFLSAEDGRFERHLGVDPLAVARATWQLARRGRVVSGASTLTMQLARQLVPRRRSLTGKLGEALWALRLEAHLDKDTILRAYLDRVPLGRGLFGVEAASRTHFGRPARALSAGQAALLAALARSPATLDPWRHPLRARAGALAVLDRMESRGRLGAEAARMAREAPLDLVPGARAFRAPHLVDALSARLYELGLEPAVEVRTTLDPALQRDVEEIVAAEVEGDPRLGNAAAIVVDNRSGEVLAYAGSAGWLDEERLGQNDGVRSPRQPGSALKPFAYGLALARGMTPATLIADVNLRLATPAGDWVPRNYDRREHGPVRLRAALQNSYNVAAVRVTDLLGPAAVLDVLRRAGFASLDGSADRYGAGVVLGNGDVTLHELARAYRGLARGGVLGPLVEVRDARDPAGRPLAPAREPFRGRFLPAGAVALLTDILSDEAARAPAFGRDNALRLPFPVAAKTGTSRAYVDNWTAGFTAERTVAVWAGRFDGRPMQGVSGITGAAPIFRRVMVRAMRGLEPAPLLDRARFEHVQVCPLSGARAGPRCPASLDEVFLPGTAPRGECPMHGGAGLVLGPEYAEWARSEGIPAAEATAPGTAVRLLEPTPGDEFLVEAGYPDGAQSVPVRLAVPAGMPRVELRVDGLHRELGPPFRERLALSAGRHRLEVWLPGGRAPAASADFTVHGARR